MAPGALRPQLAGGVGADFGAKIGLVGAVRRQCAAQSNALRPKRQGRIAAQQGVQQRPQVAPVPGLSMMLLNDLNGSGWYLSLGIGERAQL